MTLTIKQTDPSQYPPALAPFVAYLQSALSSLWDDLAANTLTPDEWYAAMLDELTTSYSAAYMAGVGTPDLAPDDLANIAYYVGNQAKYLDNFRFVIQSAEQFLPGWKARAEMYAAGIAAPYWKGQTKVLPLPAMPADLSSICGSNDRCLWDIQVIDEEKGDYDCYWVLEPDVTQHCQTCLERAALWNPLPIRDGRIQLTYLAPAGLMENKEVGYKHLAGHHNQKRHGWRYGGGAGGTYKAVQGDIISDDASKEIHAMKDLRNVILSNLAKSLNTNLRQLKRRDRRK